MDQKLLREREAKCIQECQPGCTAGCPVHVDVRGMIAAVRKGDYRAGYGLFRPKVLFPGIISRICDQPCQQACTRAEIDESILVNLLERTCVENNDQPPVTTLPLLANNKRAVIVGAGLSALAAAVELARKGYKTVIYEATDRLGGSIWNIPEERLPRQVIVADFAIFEKLPVEIHYNTTVTISGDSGPNLESLCKDFDAVYLGVGRAAIGFTDIVSGANEISAIDPVTLAIDHPNVFAGGSIRRDGITLSPISSISDGKIAANSIDRLFQNASLSANREMGGALTSGLYTKAATGVQPEPAVPADPVNGYTRDEALREANRCLQCECRECVKVCEFLDHYGSYPKKYVREVYNNLSIVMGIHHANKMINSCSLCGMCSQVCPNNLDMGEICLEARQMMVDKGKMPPSAHDFALRDMQFSNSDKFVLTRHQPGFTSSNIVFYPGCQLAASSPQHVRKVYDFLCTQIPGGVGLMLGCCGAPANWAGQREQFQHALKSVKDGWSDLGRPKVITACPTCYSVFQQYLPDMPTENLWTLLDDIGLPASGGSANLLQKLAVHDSCTTRNDVRMQESVRSILGKLGHQIEELPRSRQYTTCCGYGGLMVFANREVANKEITRRIRESETDYITYCAMCRDNFSGAGKRTFHLLDLIYGPGGESGGQQKPPDYSERRANRAKLKMSLLREVWGENMAELTDDSKVTIPEDVRRSMEDRLILVSDVVSVIKQAESSGCKLQDSTSGHYIAYLQLVNVTYWVEYSLLDDGFLVHNSYCHRLQIVE